MGVYQGGAASVKIEGYGTNPNLGRVLYAPTITIINLLCVCISA